MDSLRSQKFKKEEQLEEIEKEPKRSHKISEEWESLQRKYQEIEDWSGELNEKLERVQKVNDMLNSWRSMWELVGNNIL